MTSVRSKIMRKSGESEVELVTWHLGMGQLSLDLRLDVMWREKHVKCMP